MNNPQSFTHRLINEADRQACVAVLAGYKLGDKPFVMKIVKLTEKRRLAQNSLLHVFYGMISKRFGNTFKDVIFECKMEFGIPIFLRDKEGFAGQWEVIESGLSYLQLKDYIEDKPMTSKMSVQQFSEYLNNMIIFYAEQGLVLRSSNEEEFNLAMGRFAK